LGDRLYVQHCGAADGVVAFVEDGIEEANQNIMALFGTKDFFKGVIGFGVDKAHGFSLKFVMMTKKYCKFS